mgnify:CR=1 FL=1
MCGIVGYIGHQKARPILIEGLKRLEYRGYDSAGVAFLENGQFRVVRAKGKLSELVTKMNGQSFDATIGIGHTRWATHGRPDETNAHPHHSKDVVLVHNGIIENFKTLKTELEAKGHKVVSQTDTEVICHLIQDHINQGQNFFDAFKNSLKKLRGAYSLVVLDRNDVERVYVARKGSPLVVGLKKGEVFVASDIPALLDHTRDVVYMHDYEFGVLSRLGVEFYDYDFKKIKKEPTRITWTATQAEKGGYKHFMLREINEQPRAIADTLLGRVDQDTLSVKLGEADALLEKMVKNPNFQLQIIACGTSWHAGLVGRYWIENLAKIQVSVDLSSEFRYRQPLVNKNTLVIAISQSGETADTLAAIRESKQLGAQVLSICNVIESSIPRESDATVYTHAGPEIGVASTKAYTTQLSVLYMIAIKLALLKDLLQYEDATTRIQALIEIPYVMKSFLKKLNKIIPDLADNIVKKDHCYFIGRGIQFPVVLEGALKLKEISYVHAEGFAGGELKHGPIALIEDGAIVVAVVLKDSQYEKMVSNVLEVKSRGGWILGLVSEDDKDMVESLDEVVRVPVTHQDLYPFFTAVPLQLLAYHVADHKGTDVDQPRNLAKSVTVE